MKKNILLLFLFLLLSSCGQVSKDVFLSYDSEYKYSYSNINNLALYESGLQKIRDGRTHDALEDFHKITDKDPYSHYAAEAQAMIIFVNYLIGEVPDVRVGIDKFRIYYPNSPYTPWVDYMEGLSAYDEVIDVRRDQQVALASIHIFKNLASKYPNAIYAEDIGLRIEFLHNQLAAKHLNIARYYEKRKDYVAAIKRYQDVIYNYGNTIYVAEALHRLSSTLLRVGIKDEAQKIAAVLGRNYPSSYWYKETKKLFEKE